MSGNLQLAQGAGGQAMQELLNKYILDSLRFPGSLEQDLSLEDLDDASAIRNIVLTTDSHTVKPLFFPGGDIGTLSVAGTINDLAVVGAEPIALALGLILEEGLPLITLERVMSSIGKSSRECGVPVITGDTKVVERGAVDNIITNTSGIGIRNLSMDQNFKRVRESRPIESKWLKDSNLREGDLIILSGTVGDHGIALLSFREGYGFEAGGLTSDIAPLNAMVANCLKIGGIVAMKDPTRGGLANTLNEWSQKSDCGIFVEEERIPLKDSVVAACELLGLDPLEIGNEGKIVIGVVAEAADDLLSELRRHPEGRDSSIVGKVTRRPKAVVMETIVGARRVIEAPLGDPVPRIC
ncbi:MAG: hydrogenase expression/formation protein HypE [Candidatus Heimdallarchaeota archaeon]